MAELLQRKAADQSIKDFCLQNNLSEARYYYWRRKLMGNAEENKEGFISVKVKNTFSDGIPLATLEFPTGNRLTIYDSSILPILKTLL